jgi:pimeloyl-ACP methyl ester carboxylesterase
MQSRPIPLVALWMILASGSFAGCSPRTASEPGLAQPTSERQVIVEEVQFRHGDDVLAGSLYRPDLPGQHPAVAMVLGSGAQDRIYGGMGTALGRHFARNGFVWLAWDKPGVGKSTGDFNTQTFHDRAEESLAALRFLRARPEVRADAVGLWGHSQGGMVVPLAASLSNDVAFLMQISGWQGPAWKQDLIRVESELRADKFAESEVEAAVAFTRKRMDLIRSDQAFEELDREQEAVKGERWFPHVHRCDRQLFYSARRMVGYDNSASWEAVHCPVLVIYGDKDTSAGPPDELVAIIRRGLAKSGNRDLTVKIFPDADHSLCKTGGRKKAEQRKQARGNGNDPDFVPGYLETMIDWPSKRTAAVP